jgi:hypothetical protein
MAKQHDSLVCISVQIIAVLTNAMHMIAIFLWRCRYVPWNWGKAKYKGDSSSGSSMKSKGNK